MPKILRYITPDDNYHLYDNHLMALHTSHFAKFFGDADVPFEFKIHFTDCLLFIHMWLQENDSSESVSRYKYENCREFLIIWEKKLTVSDTANIASSDFVNAGDFNFVATEGIFSRLIDNKNYDHLLLRPFTSDTNKLLFAKNLLFPYNKVTELMAIFKNLANGVFTAVPLSVASAFANNTPLPAWSRL